MKRNPLLLLLVAVFLALLSPRPAGASVSFDFFYENLSPHGEWVEADGYGTCWRPSGIDADWAPYTDGYWVYTDAGWTWVSYEDFGSVTYHYGRWVRIDGYGWIWKPDYEWAPAWVSWRYSDDYVGWAPLPPEARWDSGVGISVWADRDYDIGPGYYSFCETRHFGAPVLRNVLVGRSLNITIINKTKNVTNITYRKDKTVYSGGPDYRRISGKSHRRIETLKLERRTEWNRKEKFPRNHRVGNGLVVGAPVIERSGRPSQSPRISRRIEKPKVDKGWNNIADASARNRTRAKMQEETKGLSRKNAPARPVDDRAFEEAVAARNAKREDRRKEDKPSRQGNNEAPRPREEKENQRDESQKAGPVDRTGRNDREGLRQRDEQRQAEKSAQQQQQIERERKERHERDQQKQRNEERDRQRDEQRKAERDQQREQADRARREGEQRQRDEQRNAERNQQREQADRARREGEQRQRDEQRRAERNVQRQQQEQADRARREVDRGRENDRGRNDRGRENDRSRNNERNRERAEKKQDRSSESSEKKGKKNKD